MPSSVATEQSHMNKYISFVLHSNPFVFSTNQFWARTQWLAFIALHSMHLGKLLRCVSTGFMSSVPVLPTQNVAGKLQNQWNKGPKQDGHLENISF